MRSKLRAVRGRDARPRRTGTPERVLPSWRSHMPRLRGRVACDRCRAARSGPPLATSASTSLEQLRALAAMRVARCPRPRGRRAPSASAAAAAARPAAATLRGPSTRTARGAPGAGGRARARADVHGEAVDQLARVGAEPGEERQVVRAAEHADRVELQQTRHERSRGGCARRRRARPVADRRSPARPARSGGPRRRSAAWEPARCSGRGAGADALGEDRGESGAVALGSAEQRGVELRALVEPVHVRLPGEADAAVGLDRARGDLAPGGRTRTPSPSRPPRRAARARRPPSRRRRRRSSAPSRFRAASARSGARRPGRSRRARRTVCGP